MMYEDDNLFELSMVVVVQQYSQLNGKFMPVEISFSCVRSILLHCVSTGEEQSFSLIKQFPQATT